MLVFSVIVPLVEDQLLNVVVYPVASFFVAVIVFNVVEPDLTVNLLLLVVYVTPLITLYVDEFTVP